MYDGQKLVHAGNKMFDPQNFPRLCDNASPKTETYTNDLCLIIKHKYKHIWQDIITKTNCDNI